MGVNFMKNIRSELYKIFSLPLFWRGVAIVIGISVFFTFQNIQVINEIANGNTDILILEDATSQLTGFQTVRDALRNTNICDTNQCQYNLWVNWLVHKIV